MRMLETSLANTLGSVTSRAEEAIVRDNCKADSMPFTELKHFRRAKVRGMRDEVNVPRLLQQAGGREMGAREWGKIKMPLDLQGEWLPLQHWFLELSLG